MTAYYNEFDKNAAAWIRELIHAGHITHGDVDERSIEDVHPNDLVGYQRVHFFAGIAGWDHALNLAGWGDKEVWTGSAPCQPFSAAGKGAGFADERHLWPAFFHLIEQCRPPVVFGEQVASRDGLDWLDLVHADLEGSGYAVGAADLCAAGFGAPHIRQRLYWVAHSSGARLEGRDEGSMGHERKAAQRGGRIGGLANSNGRNAGSERQQRGGQQRQQPENGGVGVWMADGHDNRLGALAIAGLHDAECHSEPCGSAGRMADATGGRDFAGFARADQRGLKAGDGFGAEGSHEPGPTNGFWRDADWLGCRDGKWRPVSASAQPMVDGIPESLGRVRDEVVKALEGEVNAWELESGIGRTEALRDLWNAAREAAPRVWAVGGIPGLHEASFLLAFMRQLAQQGWGIPECLSVPREEVPEGRLRVLWGDIGASCASHRHGLEEQRRGQYPDALRVLSSVLARHAHQAWEIAHAAYAESQFPLVHGARGRVARLRGYGNAIVPQVAEAFIRASGVIA